MEYEKYLPSKQTIKKYLATGLVALALTGAALSTSGCNGMQYVPYQEETYSNTHGGGNGGGGGGGPGGGI